MNNETLKQMSILIGENTKLTEQLAECSASPDWGYLILLMFWSFAISVIVFHVLNDK